MAGGAARDRLPEGRTMFAFFMADRSFFFFWLHRVLVAAHGVFLLHVPV